MAKINWIKQWTNANGKTYWSSVQIGKRHFSIFKVDDGAYYNLSELQPAAKAKYKILYTKDKMSLSELKKFFAPKNKNRDVKKEIKNTGNKPSPGGLFTRG
jgi:hypothetical protein